ncbi:MAG: hypothetical protein ABGZ53_20065 [Fuerstiella sp.]|nr:hypothetical protein [Fuerstiella sp.]
MLLRTLIATIVGCVAMLAQESTLTSEPTTAAESASDSAKVKPDRTTSIGPQLPGSESEAYLEVYTFKTIHTGRRNRMADIHEICRAQRCRV